MKKHYVLNRRKPQHAPVKGRFRWLWRAGLAAMLVSALVLGLGMVPRSPGAPAMQHAGLVIEHKMYAANQVPVLWLRPNSSVVTAWFGGGVALADTQPQVTVEYNGHVVDLPVTASRQADGSFRLELRPKGAVKPGKYVVHVKYAKADGQYETQDQSFAWGVLALNFDRSVYTLGQTVQVQMGVLSSTGHTICDAPLNLTISNDRMLSDAKPQVQASGKCNGDSYVDVPDYTAQFTPATAGTYNVKLQLADSDYTMTDQFQVLDSAPEFDVVRTGPSRIWPYAPYTMDMAVTPAQDFNGTVVESMPDSFTLKDNGGAVLSPGREGSQQLTWSVDWRAGQTYHLSYTFKAPLVSPAFYTLGPLQFLSGSQAVWKEVRQWQIASDAVITLVHNTTGNGTFVSGTPYALTLSASTTPGNTLVLLIGVSEGSGSASFGGVTDNGTGNTWVQPANNCTSSTAGNPPCSAVAGSNSLFIMAYCVTSSAISTVSVANTSATSKALTVEAYEFSNVSSGTPVDQAASQADGTAAATQSTATLTTTNANDLIIGGLTVPSGTLSVSSAGYTATTGGSAAGYRELGAYQIVAATGSYSISFATSTVVAGTGVMAFEGTAAAGCTPTMDQLMRGGNYFCNGSEASAFFWAQ